MKPVHGPFLVLLVITIIVWLAAELRQPSPGPQRQAAWLGRSSAPYPSRARLRHAVKLTGALQLLELGQARAAQRCGRMA